MHASRATSSLITHPPPLPPHPHQVTRKMLRTRSKAIQTLRSMVGTSEAIYLRIKDLITRRYRDSESLYFGTKELSVCILRSQVGHGGPL